MLSQNRVGRFQLEDSTFKIGDKYKTYKITFDEYCYQSLTSSSNDELVRMKDFLTKNKHIVVEIGYHLGVDSTNYSGCLPSHQASSTVRKELIKLGVRKKQLQIKGYGFSKPCCTHPYRNQRIELIIIIIKK